MKKILIVEDEKHMLNLLRIHLDPLYLISEAKDGAKALELIRKSSYDLIILDIMLPYINGWDICETIRKNNNTPILMLTARSDINDRVKGLEKGADDYLVKPFDFDELKARVMALLRRSRISDNQSPIPPVITLYDDILRIHLENREVYVNNTLIELTEKEFDLLSKLASSPMRVFTREVLLDHIWEDHESRELRLVDTHIKNIRLKFKKVEKNLKIIQTVWGLGYKISGKEGA